MDEPTLQGRVAQHLVSARDNADRLIEDLPDPNDTAAVAAILILSIRTGLGNALVEIAGEIDNLRTGSDA
jgi:hypothetical protein